jgi:hypothetical protein
LWVLVQRHPAAPQLIAERNQDPNMKIIIRAAIAVLSLGIAAANAAAPNSSTANQQSGDQFNYTRGGGG